MQEQWLLGLILTAPLALFTSAGCQAPAETSPPLPPFSSPIPERAPDVAARTAPVTDPSPIPTATPQLTRLLDAPLPTRLATPGRVRWAVDMDAPITFVRWSPLTGLVASVGPEVHNVTSWGERRWHVVAGHGHRLFAMGDHEIAWMPKFKRLTEIRRWGRLGWNRKWHGELTGDDEQGFFLLDAATVAVVGPDGKDRWRASLEGLRRLEGPYACTQGTLFHGIRGLEGVAVVISKRGAVMRETILERGAVVLGASPACEPLVWLGGAVALLDSRGIEKWHVSATSAPIVHRLPGGFLLASHGNDARVRLTAIRDSGTTEWSTALPLTGRLTRLGVIPGVNLRARAIGLCLDVSSPCARPETNRGPFNALLTPTADGSFRALLRHTAGHLQTAAHPNGGYIVASSAEEDITELTLRGDEDAVIWQVTLPGRLSAGPSLGPSGEIYLGTCHGWDCGSPRRLIAVTATKPEPNTTKSEVESR